MVRWGLPGSSQKIFEATKKRAAGLDAKDKSYDFNEMLKKETDKGMTNVRRTHSKHWDALARPGEPVFSFVHQLQRMG